MSRLYFPDREVYKENYVDFVGIVYAENSRAKDDGESEVYNRTDNKSKKKIPAIKILARKRRTQMKQPAKL